jgi:hypothetical protein
MKSINRCLVFVLFFCQLQSQAQSFLWKSRLDTVPSSGFYTIPLSTDWLAVAKTDLSDIRMKDQDNRVVPYLIKKLPAESTLPFSNFPILKNTTDTVSTTVDIDVSRQHGTEHLYLVISNNAAERFTSLSGSDDGRHWFIIDERLPLTNSSDYSTGHFVQQLNFPFIKYHFLRLVINNKGTYPLQILNAGVFTDGSRKESLPLYIHDGTTYSQKDSVDGNTYVSVHNTRAYPVDRVSLILSNVKLYNRPVRAYSIDNEKRQKLITVSQLRSGEEATIVLSPVKTKDLLLVIENGDNPPLKVNAVKTQTRVRELLAYLENGKQYTLFGGNDSATAPEYDLASFRDSIPSHSPTLNHGTLVQNEATVAGKTTNYNWWIWFAIVTALTVLVSLTYRLMADIKRGKK